ncbi:hypothetical protein DICPUDRAFT_92180 [Dictyostelium purpureum]|uniref:C4-dicarboxylate transporter/malic acid transport protein n=1 Tax=Dictyostelium purpureum TaxID=5786 RepID=F0ZN60_DICPU|nr:uncharacterized protein DICPUDRAFT_92180 [Dictyostelium purpureum]EGC34624.1 hypothetical protein DICPUDRAFT_92180 [Dictyostelium purpureum]|eukprot:XP_003288849.1 hypothetical protein DICPUDRAFT_92180 [Dictyostelium purpureum]
MQYLFLFTTPKLNDNHYLNKNKKISTNKMTFKDDKTCFSLINDDNINSYNSYSRYFTEMYFKLKNQSWIPDQHIQTIFSSYKLNSNNNINKENRLSNSETSISNSENYHSSSSISSSTSTSSMENLSIDPTQDNNNIINKETVEQNPIEFESIQINDSNKEIILEIDYKDEETLDLSNYKWTKYVQILIFLIIISTAGLGSQWRLIYIVFNTPPIIYLTIGAIACVFWATALIVLSYSFISNRQYTKKNLKGGLNVTIYNIMSLSFFQIADIANYVNRTLAIILFWIAAAVLLCTMLFTYIHFALRIKRKHPISFTPSFVFSGGALIIVGSVAKHIGYTTIAWITFGYGSIYSVIVHFLIIIEYCKRGRKGFFVPLELIPTQSIFVGYSSFIFSTLVTIQEKLTLFSRLLFLYAILNIIFVIVSWAISIKKAPRRYIPPFNLGMWGFSFPAISFGVCTIFYYKYTPFLITKIFTYIIIIISNLIYFTLISCTIYSVSKKNLFIVSKFNKSSFLSPKFNNIKNNNNNININLDEIKNNKL